MMIETCPKTVSIRVAVSDDDNHPIWVTYLTNELQLLLNHAQGKIYTYASEDKIQLHCSAFKTLQSIIILIQILSTKFVILYVS
jgi:hypothetical protein